MKSKFAKLTMVSSLALVAIMPAAAMALDANAATDLNIRSGPANNFTVLGVIPGGEAATLDGCIDDGTWCQVSYDGIQGWSYAPYLTVSAEEQAYVVTERPSAVEVTTVTYEDTGETMKDERAGATAGAVLGSLTAYAVGGPVGGIIAGGILGGAAGSAAVEPTTETVTYIESNPVETIYLDGEVAVGAGVPKEVTLYEIPAQSEYRYVNINGQTVLVNPETNAIVRVVR
tara:strand:- start:7448 stop:8137 length:690 start_codon:yes stop_codon:yes gene_type:complete